MKGKLGLCLLMQSHALYIVLRAKRLARHREDIRETGVRSRCEKLGPRVLPLGSMLIYKLCCLCAQNDHWGPEFGVRKWGIECFLERMDWICGCVMLPCFKDAVAAGSCVIV